METSGKCPICLQIPRPDEISTYGICVNGHLGCASCSTSWIEKSNKNECFYCRSYFSVHGHHMLANIILKNLTDGHKYPCKFCNLVQSGFELLQHETNCTSLVDVCSSCYGYAYTTEIQSLVHPCISKSLIYQTDLKRWSLYLPFKEMNSMSTSILLYHPQKIFKTCFKFQLNSKGFVGEMVSMDRNLPPILITQIEVTVHTKAGVLGRSNLVPIISCLLYTSDAADE